MGTSMITNCYFCGTELDTEEDDVHTDPETGEDCCAECCPECNPKVIKTKLETMSIVEFLKKHPSSYIGTNLTGAGYKIYPSEDKTGWIAKSQWVTHRALTLEQLLYTVSQRIRYPDKKRANAKTLYRYNKRNSSSEQEE